MITPQQRLWVESHAFIPEHLPAYVTSIAPSEPFLVEDYLVYLQGEVLIFIGYPLDSEPDEARLSAALEHCHSAFHPSLISIIAPSIPSVITAPSIPNGIIAPSIPKTIIDSDPPAFTQDFYYRLDLADLRLSKKLRSLLKRAGRDLIIECTQTWTRESQRLVDAFKRSHRPDRELRLILDRLPQYVRSGAPLVFQAHDRRGNLVAMDIADFNAGSYAFYLFNFRSPKHVVPGASDLLLAALIEHTRRQGKRFINLGLGINSGIAAFKLKWGAEKFLPYRAFVQRLGEQVPLEDLLGNFLR